MEGDSRRLPRDCRPQECELYVFNGNKRKKAPAVGCTCNKVFKKTLTDLQCDTCGRWCHKPCTHLAGLSMAQHHSSSRRSSVSIAPFAALE
eukprot:7375862-Prymnesium_polylepis.1